jgi:hypothetical protein
MIMSLLKKPPPKEGGGLGVVNLRRITTPRPPPSLGGGAIQSILICRGMKGHPLTFILVALALSAMVVGCSLFSTRTPQPPDTASTFIWIPATTPELLMSNLTGTLNILDASDYIRVFVSSTDSTSTGQKTFSFTPAPGLDQNSQAIFTNWNTQSEEAWVQKLSSLLPASSQLIVTLSNSVTDQSGASNTATYSADYVISIPTSSSGSALPSVVQGSLQMQLALVTTEQGTTEWRIVSWSDFPLQNGNSPTWTDLKVQLSS